MKDRINKHILAATVIFCFIVSIVVTEFSVHFKMRALESTINSEVNTELSVLRDMAVKTDRNDVDAVVGNVVHDCTERTTYENLLNNIETLNQEDLLRLQSYADTCGTYFATRKMLMVALFEREYQYFTKLIEIRSTLTKADSNVYQLDSWTSLVDFEKKRAVLLVEQSDIQDQIVAVFIKKNAEMGVEIRRLSGRAQEINGLLSVYDKQIDELRLRLME